MTPEQRAKHYAQVFPKYPQLRYDSRWLDGVWVLGQNYRGSGLHGSYPPQYLDRLRAVFPQEFNNGRVLHLFSGSLDASVGGIRVDLSLEREPPPDVYGDAHRLPFADATFDLIVADGPYTSADAKKYGTPMMNRAAVFRETARIMKQGGHLIWLDQRHPMHRKSEWLWWGVIALVRSTNHAYRATTFYQRRQSPMSKLRVKLDEAGRLLAAAFAIILGEDAATVAEAVAEQKKNTKVRETGDSEEDTPKRGRGRPPGSSNKPKVADDDDDEDDEPVAKKKGPKPPADDDDDDEDADEDSADIPKDAALAEMKRDALKALAVANKLDAAGKNREDLTKLLQEKRDGKKDKPAKKVKDADEDDDEDDEDEKPAKKKATVKADVDGPEDDDYPKIKVMKADLEVFIKLNKDMLKASGFFGGKPKKGTAKAENTYDEIMGDVDLIKEAWADNVWPEIQSDNWKKMKAEAAEIEDEDDDE